MPNYYNWSTEEDNQFGFHEDDQAEHSQTDVEELWFAGCHGGKCQPPQRLCSSSFLR